MIFAHFPRITWRAYSLKNYNAEYTRDTRAFVYPGFVIAVYPSPQDTPDRYSPGLLKCSSENQYTHHVIGHDSYPHIEALLHNASLNGVMDECGAMMEAILEKMKNEPRELHSDKMIAAWGNMNYMEQSDLFSGIFSHVMPYWLGE